MIRFAHWWFFFLIPVLAWLFWALRKKRGLDFSSLKLLWRVKDAKTIKSKIGKSLMLFGLVLAVVALARPQAATFGATLPQGIDIAILLDLSASMRSKDFPPTREDAAKQIVDDFIAGRGNDRIALIIYAGDAYTRIPLTLDHKILRASLAEVSWAMVFQSGTAIGTAIGVGINRLRKSDAASQIMILVTDGDNNAGTVDPLTAANLARDLGIKIYTVGIGSNIAQTWYTLHSFYNEELLIEIARITGGQYFPAWNADALSMVFETIDQLEKTEFQDDLIINFNELAFPLIQAAILFMLAGIILDRYYFLQVP